MNVVYKTSPNWGQSVFSDCNSPFLYTWGITGLTVPLLYILIFNLSWLLRAATYSPRVLQIITKYP